MDFGRSATSTFAFSSFPPAAAHDSERRERQVTRREVKEHVVGFNVTTQWLRWQGCCLVSVWVACKYNNLNLINLTVICTDHQ